MHACYYSQNYNNNIIYADIPLPIPIQMNAMWKISYVYYSMNNIIPIKILGVLNSNIILYIA